MDIKIKSQTNQYFFNVFFWWLVLVVTIFMFTFPGASDGLFKFGISLLALYSGLKFLFSFFKIFSFIDQNEKTNTSEEILNDFLSIKEIKRRSIFDYLKKIPIEHPYILLSILGLIITEQYTDFSLKLYQSIENIPILNIIFPSLPLVKLLLIFGDYTYHINSKYIRRTIKAVVLIYSPFIIGFFFLGLFNPMILILNGMFNIASIQDILMFFSSVKNLFWLLVYPWTVFYLMKCIFIEDRQLIDVKSIKAT